MSLQRLSRALPRGTIAAAAKRGILSHLGDVSALGASGAAANHAARGSPAHAVLAPGDRCGAYTPLAPCSAPPLPFRSGGSAQGGTWQGPSAGESGAHHWRGCACGARGEQDGSMGEQMARASHEDSALASRLLSWQPHVPPPAPSFALCCGPVAASLAGEWAGRWAGADVGPCCVEEPAAAGGENPVRDSLLAWSRGLSSRGCGSSPGCTGGSSADARSTGARGSPGHTKALPAMLLQEVASEPAWSDGDAWGRPVQRQWRTSSLQQQSPRSGVADCAGKAASLGSTKGRPRRPVRFKESVTVFEYPAAS